MKINVKITRDENAAYYGVSPGDTVSVELETYVAGVVASEIGNSAIEACKAQAVAARTFAANKGVLDGTVITDSSSSDQAYRATRTGSGLYPNAEAGARQTAGEILTYNGKPIPAVYSASNGGRTVASKTRWGSMRPYLIEQDDPWDNSEKRTGHGVGMSQRGAKAMAAAGKSYREILAFYYPGTQISTLPAPETEEKGAGHMIPVKQFIEKVKIPLEEGWGYVYGTHGTIWTKEKQAAATREQTVKYGSQWIGKMVTDCSGLIYWACMELGEKVVHHATYLYTDWSRPKGRLVNCAENAAGETKCRDDGQPIKPGTLVFLKGSEEKIHHVGVYIGDDTVIEAKGTRSGVVTSRLSHWEYWGELKVIDYCDIETPADEKRKEEPMTPETKATYATVDNPHTWLNVRNAPNSGATRVFRVQRGTLVQVLDMSNPQWWLISYNGNTGYASAEYLRLKGSDDVMIEPQATAAPTHYEYPDIPGWNVDEEYEVPEEKPWPDANKYEQPDILGALKTVSGDLDILKRLTDDAQKAPSAEGLIEILNAMDKVLPQIEAATKEMWRLVSVG